jgi:hypothetical protein
VLILLAEWMNVKVKGDPHKGYFEPSAVTISPTKCLLFGGMGEKYEITLFL